MKPFQQVGPHKLWIAKSDLYEQFAKVLWVILKAVSGGLPLGVTNRMIGLSEVQECNLMISLSFSSKISYINGHLSNEAVYIGMSLSQVQPSFETLFQSVKQ